MGRSAIRAGEAAHSVQTMGQSAPDTAGFYGRIMTSDGVMVLAHGQVCDRQAVIDSLDQAPPWRTYDIATSDSSPSVTITSSSSTPVAPTREEDEPRPSRGLRTGLDKLDQRTRWSSSVETIRVPAGHASRP